MQRPVQIGDGGRVTLLPGYPRFVGIILRVPKSVVVLQHERIHFVLHHSPIEQHIVIEGKNMVEGPDELATSRILMFGYIEWPVRVFPGDRCNESVFDRRRVVAKTSGESHRSRAVNLHYFCRVL
jgi:hypothetical protein